MAVPLDWNNPCAALDTVREQYWQIVAGGGMRSIQVGSERVDYGQANLAQLAGLMQRLEVACAQANGNLAPRRFAISGGGVRRSLIVSDD